MPFSIRPMEARDAEAVARLMGQLIHTEVSAADMLDRLDWVEHSPIDWLFVAEVTPDAGSPESGAPIEGVLGFRLRENVERVSRYGEISVIVVDEAARRGGVGRALMAFAENLAREQGCIGTWLVSGFKRVDEAHRFYAELGYEITGYRFVKRFND